MFDPEGHAYCRKRRREEQERQDGDEFYCLSLLDRSFRHLFNVMCVAEIQEITDLGFSQRIDSKRCMNRSYLRHCTVQPTLDRSKLIGFERQFSDHILHSSVKPVMFRVGIWVSPSVLGFFLERGEDFEIATQRLACFLYAVLQLGPTFETFRVGFSDLRTVCVGVCGIRSLYSLCRVSPQCFE